MPADRGSPLVADPGSVASGRGGPLGCQLARSAGGRGGSGNGAGGGRGARVLLGTTVGSGRRREGLREGDFPHRRRKFCRKDPPRYCSGGIRPCGVVQDERPQNYNNDVIIIHRIWVPLVYCERGPSAPRSTNICDPTSRRNICVARSTDQGCSS